MAGTSATWHRADDSVQLWRVDAVLRPPHSQASPPGLLQGYSALGHISFPDYVP